MREREGERDCEGGSGGKEGEIGKGRGVFRERAMEG